MYFKELQEKFNMIKKRMDPETIEREKRFERKKGMIKGFAVGSIIAGITALFLSPDSGKNNREKAKEELGKVKDTLETNIIKGKRRLAQVYEDAKEIIDDRKIILTEKLKPSSEVDISEEDFEEPERAPEEIEKDPEEMEDEETEDEQ